MPDLDVQLRSYGETLDERFPDIPLDEALHRLAERKTPQTVPLRRGMLVAVVAALTVLFLVGGIALLVLQQSEEVPPVVSTPTTLGPPPTLPEGLPEPTEISTVNTSFGTWTWTRYDGSVPELSLLDPVDEPADSVDTPNVPLPEIAGMTWSSAMTTPRHALLGDVEVLTAMATGEVDWHRWGIRTVTDPTWLDGEQSFLLDDHVVAVTVDHEARTVTLVDRDTGGTLFELTAPEGFPVEALTGEASRYGPGWYALVIGLHVGDSWITPPWQDLHVEVVDVVAVGDRLMAVATVRPPWEEPDRSSLLYSWTSEDGVNWAPHAGPVSLDHTVLSFELLTSDGAVVAVILQEGGTDVWVSQDGGEWERAQFGKDGQIDNWARAARLGDLWALTVDTGDACDVWLSRNGKAWELVDESPGPWSGSVTRSNCQVFGESVIALRDLDGQGTRWIGTLQP